MHKCYLMHLLIKTTRPNVNNDSTVFSKIFKPVLNVTSFLSKYVMSGHPLFVQLF